jgi:lipoprotein-anchoring transpeptidase ErfK/SrfK
MGAKNTCVAAVLAALLCVPAQPWAKNHARRMRRTEGARRPEIKAEDVNNPNLTPDLSQGARGSAVVRTQILLDRQHFSPGEIDGEFGSNLAKCVAAFRAARNLGQGGRVDAPVWAALNQDNAPALVSYQITGPDVAGPFTKVPSDMMEQAQLPALGYESPQEELGERFHASPKLLAALNPDKQLDKAGEQIQVPNLEVSAPGEAASVVVSKADSSVTALDRDGKVLAWYPATIGSEHDPLPLGNWKIKGVERNPEFHYNPNLFWDAEPKDQKALIKPGPNNPVGVVWIALSKEHYGIHGAPEPSEIGHAESHGCVRLTNWDASELAGMVKPGTRAILRD